MDRQTAKNRTTIAAKIISKLGLGSVKVAKGSQVPLRHFLANNINFNT